MGCYFLTLWLPQTDTQRIFGFNTKKARSLNSNTGNIQKKTGSKITFVNKDKIKFLKNRIQY